MKRVLITGSSGFIGQKLCFICSDDYTIIAFDNVAYSDLKENFIPVKGNITDNSSLERVFKKYCPAFVIHCAGIAHQKIGSIDSEEYIRVNSLATENLSKIAIAANPNVHFIFLSSISVYGEDYITFARTEDQEFKPSSDYAHSKLDAEKRLIALHDSGKLKKLDILRLAPVYDSEWSLNLDRRVFAPRKTVYIRFGRGTQMMSAVSRQNLVDFIEYLISNSETFGDRYCHVYNVCDEKPYSFKLIIETFKKSHYHPDRFVVTVPLPLVWLLTRMAGLVFKSKRKWLHSCYDKLANDLVFDNHRMLATGFKPKHTLESVFSVEKRVSL